MGGTVRIESREELERWLKDKPVEWARVIAVRSALRVLPFVGRAFDIRNAIPRKERLVLSTFHSIFISWVASQCPTYDITAAFADYVATNFDDVASAALYAGADYAAAFVSAFASDLAADAAVNAAAAANASFAALATADASSASFASDYAASYAASAISAAASAATSSAPEIWSAVSSDVEALEREGKGEFVPLSGRSIWADGVPDFARREWTALNKSAVVASLGFGPWLMWLEGAGEGESPKDIFGEELTLRIADQPNEWWGRPAREVNADVARWLEERDAGDKLPRTQRPAAYTFAWRDAKLEARPIVLVTEDPQTAADFLSEARRVAKELMERLAATNAAPSLKRNLDLLIRSFPENPTDLRVGIVSSRVRTLGEFINPEIEAELPADAAAMLRGAVGVARDLLACYPQTREIEAERLSLKLLETDVDAARAGLVEVAERAEGVPEVVAASAREALRTLADMANEVELSLSDIAKRTAEGLLVVRNFAAATTNVVEGAEEKAREVAGSISRGVKRSADWGREVVVNAKAFAVDNKELGVKVIGLSAAYVAVSVFVGGVWADRMLCFLQVSGLPKALKKLGAPIDDTSKKDDEEGKPK